MATTEKRPVPPPAQYETLLIAEPTFEKEQVDQLLEKFDQSIQKHGGKVQKTTEWGKRRLSYEINKHNEGYYILVEFEGNGELVRKTDLYLNLQSSILRHLTVKKTRRKMAPPAA